MEKIPTNATGGTDTKTSRTRTVDPGDQFPLPTIPDLPSTSSFSSSARSSLSDAGVVNLVHPPTPDMEGVNTDQRRQKDSHPRQDSDKKVHSRRQRWRRRDTGEEEGKYSEEEDSMLDHSSRSTSEDVELNSMSDDSADEEMGLTGKGRGDRRRKKRRNTQLDRRIAGESKIPNEVRKQADQSVVRKSIVNAILIGSWYFFALSISLYNKWMFSGDHLNFPFPLFTTSMHMLVQFVLSTCVLYFLPHFRPRHDSITNPHNLQQPPTTHFDTSAAEKPLMTRFFYITRIGPCGAATVGPIPAPQPAPHTKLKEMTSPLAMCKSSALAFVLLFAFLFALETPSLRLILIIFTMTLGVIMMVAGETAFDALGFILIISSAFFSGFRWALTQILLLRNPATSNPFSSIFFLAPVMFLSLLGIALPVEGVGPLLGGLRGLVDAKGVVVGIGIVLFPGMLAFLMTASEFALLQRTSVVTLSICGIFKEVVTISAAGIVFHDQLTPINVSGLCVTIASIAAYNYIKIRKMREQARKDVQGGEGSVAVADGEVGEGVASAPEGREGRLRSSSAALRGGSKTAAGVEQVENEGGGAGTVGRVSPVKRPEDHE
ncbi:MAG: Triose-phosphate Transporter [Candelina mexicana]|nr:MAG: Triose-phosphate Transporter [Candelina mexicana]